MSAGGRPEPGDDAFARTTDRGLWTGVGARFGLGGTRHLRSPNPMKTPPAPTRTRRAPPGRAPGDTCEVLHAGPSVSLGPGERYGF